MCALLMLFACAEEPADGPMMDPPAEARGSFQAFLKERRPVLDSAIRAAGYRLPDSALATAGLGPQMQATVRQGRFTAGGPLFAYDTVRGREQLKVVSLTFGAASDTGPWYLLTYRGAVEVPTDDGEMAHMDLQAAIRDAFPTRPMAAFFRPADSLR